jgi:ankyrin repeat protein
MSREPEIFSALERGDIHRVESMLAEEPALANARNDRGDSLLLAAVYLGRGPMARKVVDAGATVGLFEAAALGDEAGARAAIDADPALVRSHSHDGWTPLHLAAFFGRTGVARLLLDRGADVNARSKSDRFARDNTPLHAAAANSQVEVATLLVERGADVNARDGSGFTPLALAANSRSDLLMLLLLEKGARAE